MGVYVGRIFLRKCCMGLCLGHHTSLSLLNPDQSHMPDTQSDITQEAARRAPGWTPFLKPALNTIFDCDLRKRARTLGRVLLLESANDPYFSMPKARNSTAPVLLRLRCSPRSTVSLNSRRAGGLDQLMVPQAGAMLGTKQASMSDLFSKR